MAETAPGTHRQRTTEAKVPARDSNTIASFVPPITTDKVYSTLLPVERMPKRIFTAPCTLTPLEINSRIGQLQAGEMAPCTLKVRTGPAGITEADDKM